MRYVSKEERLNVLILDTLAGHIENRVLPHVDKMGKDVAWRVRSAATHLKKALDAYVEILSPDDQKRYLRESKTTAISFKSDSIAPKPKQQTAEQRDIVYTLAEYSIRQNCRGCTKDGETCQLKHALAMADVPYATTEPENCPYEQ